MVEELFVSVSFKHGFGFYVSSEKNQLVIETFDDDSSPEGSIFTGLVFLLPFLEISIGTVKY